jgi:large subunit ribosomal protein L9
MKVLLIKDVYKLGRAGDIKKVADGYGRNFLIPQGLAILATAGAIKQAERIRSQAEIRRTALNDELKDLAAHIDGLRLKFFSKAGDTGKLYGSITSEDVANAIQEKTRYEVKRQQIDMQPIRTLGQHVAHVRLTMDLMPEVKIGVYREGDVVEDDEPAALAEAAAPVAAEPEAPVEPEATTAEPVEAEAPAEADAEPPAAAEA